VAKVPFPVLVIDASIAHAAGVTSKHPTDQKCCEFLQAVLDVCHRMVLTAPIREEWNKHQSGFARMWRVSMRDPGHSGMFDPNRKSDHRPECPSRPPIKSPPARGVRTRLPGPRRRRRTRPASSYRCGHLPQRKPPGKWSQPNRARGPSAAIGRISRHRPR